MSRDPISVFVELFDSLTHPRSRRAPAWWAESQSAASTSERLRDVRDMLERTGGLPTDFVAGCKRPLEKLAVLLGIDGVIGEVMRLPGDAVPRRLHYVRSRYLDSGQLGDDDHQLVLPRRDGYHGTRGAEGIYSVLENVIRVPKRCYGRIKFENALSSVDRMSAYSSADSPDGVTVGCVPFLDHHDELEFERVSRGRENFYNIRPRAALEKRVISTLWSLDNSGCVIGLVPELALSRELLAAWQMAIRRARPRSSRLRWILVGTGAVEKPAKSSPPRNTAALISRNSGSVVALQDKRRPFDLQHADVMGYGLEDKLGSGPLREFITEGRVLTVIETDFGRIGIYICEDLARFEDNMTDAKEVGLTHLLVPVFSKPLEDGATGKWSWEVQDAQKYSDGLGICLVISNSLVIQRAMTKSAPRSVIDPPIATSVSFSPLRARHTEAVLFGKNSGDPTLVSVHPVSFRRAVS